MMETGYLLFRAEGGDIAGFLTLAADNQLTIQKFCKAESICFGYLPPEEYRLAARLAKSVGVRLQILEKNGVSFALRQYRKRLGLIVWPVIFTVVLLFSQNFLWAVDVTGCETLNEETVRTAAARLGLQQGSFLPKTDLSAIADQMRQDFPNIASLALNRVGSRVEIALTETADAPLILPEDPCNVIASHTGRITAMSVTRGQAAVSLGQTVAEGELLITGITETADGKTGYDHAAGEIMAEAIFDKTFTLKLEQPEQVFTGEERICRYLDLFGKKLPLFLPDSLMEKFGRVARPYDSTEALEPLTVLDIELPVGVVTETRKFYTETKKIFTEEEALAELQEAAADYEATELTDAQIMNRTSQADVTDGVMSLKISYTCLMDIAQTQAIEVHE